MYNKCFISIIVPVYNVEEFLTECLDTIFEGQSFHDFEVILINDGSSDGSSAICDAYARKDPRVKVIHKENGGVSSARNAGLQAAVGKYIMFVDPDDYVEKDSLKKIAEVIAVDGETDVILLNAMNLYPDGSIKLREKYEKERFYKKSRNEIINSLAYKALPDCLWDKLIKREVIVKYDMHFDASMISTGDADFILKLFMCAETYNTAGVSHYFYREVREGSLTHHFEKRINYDLYLVSKWMGLAKTEYKEYESALNSWLAIIYCFVVLPRFSMLPKDIKKVRKKEVDSLKWIMRYSKGGKAALIKICYRLFGLNFMSGCMEIYCKLNKKCFLVRNSK